MFALVVSVVFLVLRAEMEVSFGHRPPPVLFMFPIILSALLGGLGPGLVSTLVSAVGIGYLAMRKARPAWGRASVSPSATDK